mmetsp:Transcript_40813/g.91819  ORF Transcript_40813/g.91819 Transcript_40813/m.91819 type:complete len:204 (+) Transcript_40813:1002-1613(+)
MDNNQLRSGKKKTQRNPRAGLVAKKRRGGASRSWKKKRRKRAKFRRTKAERRKIPPKRGTRPKELISPLERVESQRTEASRRTARKNRGKSKVRQIVVRKLRTTCKAPTARKKDTEASPRYNRPGTRIGRSRHQLDKTGQEKRPLRVRLLSHGTIKIRRRRRPHRKQGSKPRRPRRKLSLISLPKIPDCRPRRKVLTNPSPNP